MSSNDLTTVANVKAWLGLPATPTPSDTILAGLVTAASRAISAAISRPSVLPQAYVETIDLESDRVYHSHWPVRAVTSVLLDGLVVPPAPPIAIPAMGYGLQPYEGAPPGRPQALDLFGRRHARLRQRLTVSYLAGYAIEAEAWAAPAATPFSLNVAAPFGAWASDLGVIYAATGVALQGVRSAPMAGQYSVAAGVYRFSAADAGAGLAITYGYAPQDLAQAATEYAAERFRAADHIGLRSKSLGAQETISYDVSGLPAAVATLIAPYKRTAI